MVTIPNLLSGSRLVLAPAMLVLAWAGQGKWFLAAFAVSLLTDTLDGWLARRWKQTSEWGAKLDSWGDLAMFAVIPLSAWWLWPDVVKRETNYIVLALASYAAAVGVGLFKFGQVTSYHTWGAKVSSVGIGIGVLALFATKIYWPFEVGALILTLASAEEIVITLILAQARADVPSFWHARRLARTAALESEKFPQ